jgi:hypothetical protein
MSPESFLESFLGPTPFNHQTEVKHAENRCRSSEDEYPLF